MRNTGDWGMPEDKLDVARRHVRDAEENIARQTAAIATLKARGENTTSAQRLLRVHVAFLQIAQRSVAFHEQKKRHQEARD
jgi:hypothetical protein